MTKSFLDNDRFLCFMLQLLIDFGLRDTLKVLVLIEEFPEQLKVISFARS